MLRKWKKKRKKKQWIVKFSSSRAREYGKLCPYLKLIWLWFSWSEFLFLDFWQQREWETALQSKCGFLLFFIAFLVTKQRGRMSLWVLYKLGMLQWEILNSRISFWIRLKFSVRLIVFGILGMFCCIKIYF